MYGHLHQLLQSTQAGKKLSMLHIHVASIYMYMDCTYASIYMDCTYNESLCNSGSDQDFNSHLISHYRVLVCFVIITVICKILATSFAIHDDVLLHHKHICPIIYLNVMATIEILVYCLPFECQESCKPL